MELLSTEPLGFDNFDNDVWSLKGIPQMNPDDGTNMRPKENYNDFMGIAVDNKHVNKTGRGDAALVMVENKTSKLHPYHCVLPLLLLPHVFHVLQKLSFVFLQGSHLGLPVLPAGQNLSVALLRHEQYPRMERLQHPALILQIRSGRSRRPYTWGGRAKHKPCFLTARIYTPRPD